MSEDKKSDSKRNKKPQVTDPLDSGNVITFKPKNEMSVSEYVEGILIGNRVILSQAITLVESTLPRHITKAEQIIELCLPYTGDSIRIGITGVPGVGKSTFIERFGKHIIEDENRKLAVLAVDPTSSKSGGSILGDKTRMEELARNKKAFIRPSPSSGSLGGVTLRTRESILLCEAGGFDTIFVETVGVGQSETAVHSMVDCFLLLLLAGAGDELQGIKRGIMELADIIAITKADDSNKKMAELAKKQYENALSLYPKTEKGWVPSVVTCSAQENEGIDTIWSLISDYNDLMKDSGQFEQNRLLQTKQWLHDSIKNSLHDHFYEDPEIINHLKETEAEVELGKKSPFVAAKDLLGLYFKHFKSQ